MIFYFLKRAYQNIKTAVLLNALTVFTIILTMLILSTFLMLFYNVNVLLKGQKSSVEISVYLSADLEDKNIKEIEKLIKSKDEVEKVKFISKNEALKAFLSWNSRLKPVLDRMEANPLPPSYEVKLKEKFAQIESVKKFVKFSSSIKGVDRVDYSSEWLEKFSSLAAVMKGIGIFLLLLLSLATIFMISNTIRLNVYARRDEIIIMRIVGATNVFIKMPFLLEGFFHGVIGVSGSIGLLYLIYKLTYNSFNVSLNYFASNAKHLFLPSSYMITLLVLGILIGLFASNHAVSRFLRSET